MTTTDEAYQAEARIAFQAARDCERIGKELFGEDNDDN